MGESSTVSRQFHEILFDPAKIVEIADALGEGGDPDWTTPDPEEREERVEARLDRERVEEARMVKVRKAMRETLTDQQIQIVWMYFVGGLTEERIGRELGIGQRTVSESLFGKLEKGKRIGGAISKLRACLGVETPSKKTYG